MTTKTLLWLHPQQMECGLTRKKMQKLILICYLELVISDALYMTLRNNAFTWLLIKNREFSAFTWSSLMQITPKTISFWQPGSTTLTSKMWTSSSAEVSIQTEQTSKSLLSVTKQSLSIRLLWLQKICLPKMARLILSISMKASNYGSQMCQDVFWKIKISAASIKMEWASYLWVPPSVNQLKTSKANLKLSIR